MKTSIKNFLQFKGKTLLFQENNGTEWIAIKPICEALGIDHAGQYKKIKNDKILGSVYENIPMQIPGKQVRLMAALPLFYVPGWLFGIQEYNENENLKEYKFECYKILYQHFNGYVRERNHLLNEKASIKAEIKNLNQRLNNNPDFKKLNDLQGRNMRIGREMKKIDEYYIQKELFPQN